MSMVRNTARNTLLVLFLSFTSVAQVLPPPPAPAEKPKEAASAKPADYSQEASVIEKWRTSYYFNDDGTGRREQLARIKIQSEAGVQQWGQVVIGYNSANEKVDVPYVRVNKADGSVVTAPADSIQDLSMPFEKEAPVYTDYRQKHITVPGLRPGDVLEYDVVITVAPALAPQQFWMEHYFAKSGIVLDEQLELNVPKSRQITLKTETGDNPKPTEEKDRKIYLWKSSHLDPDDDDTKDKSGKLKKPKQQPDAPDVQMTTFASWEEMGRWYGSLERNQRTPTPEIRAKAAELTAGKTTDLDKIEALYDFVATNFRYISLSFGVGRFQPHSAADVLHNQYGDCKDKHTLLASLLDAEGFHASSVLINTTRKLDPAIPSPAQFDHVISLVMLGKEEVWMDTTAEVAPFRMLSYSIRKKMGLVIPWEGTPHLEETPPDPPFPSVQVQTFDGKINAFGKLDAHIHDDMRGDTELFARSLFRRVPNARWPELVKGMSASLGLDGDVTDLKVSDPANTKEPFQIDYKISVANYFDWTKKQTEMRLPLSELRLPEVDENDDNDNKKDDPIELGAPGVYDYKIHLEFPAKYVLRAPLPFTMKRDYGEYFASYKVEGTSIDAERKLTGIIRDLPQSRAHDYAAFRRAVFADTSQQFSIDGTLAGSPEVSAGTKGTDLEDAAQAALKQGKFQLAVDLFTRVVQTDPDNKTVFMNLGRAYMGLRQYKNAIEAFDKQTRQNPYDETGFNNLGWAYATDQQFDPAAAAFGKALEINPLSEYAHAALGDLYSEEKQYDKAAPELEKAVSLQSENAALRVNLGTAYLNLGQDDKAMAAFDRAIEISAGPEMWNDIAYQLSLKGVHLDRAQQYAESAVDAVVASVRNISLDQLNQRDLFMVPSLFAYWDTLGWVYFAKGDLANAEKYVSASWMLGGHSEVGDHLGQIYEKEGRKDDAIRAYATALSGIRPKPETRAHLAALVGESKVDALVNKHREDLSNMRTVNVGSGPKDAASAEFFVLLKPSGNGAVVDGVKFISGDEKLKVLSDGLRNAKYNLTFPDDAPVKILRRGVASCSKVDGKCMFVMMLPEDVHTVD